MSKARASEVRRQALRQTSLEALGPYGEQCARHYALHERLGGISPGWLVIRALRRNQPARADAIERMAADAGYWSGT